MLIAVIDNYDSFTYNLVQYLRELGSEVSVFHNDAIDAPGLRDLRPDHILISPGPGNPFDAGVSMEIIRRLGAEIPILGVCLGHQCIGEVYGARVVRADRLMHGKTSQIYHNGDGLFAGLSNPFQAARYHSLIVETPLPPELEATAFTAEGELMGLRHTQHPIFGVQFHPESILTPEGRRLLRNFLDAPQTNGSPAGESAAPASS